jgi:NAD(P) transhydrogenase subunit beta
LHWSIRSKNAVEHWSRPKRGQGKGYAGSVNALFYADNCNMVYGDAATVRTRMIEAVRGLGSKAAA